MRKTLLSVALAMASFGLQAADANYQVVPLPQSITANKGAAFVLDGATAINVVGNDAAMMRNAQFLKQYIKEVTGIELAATGKKTITLALNAKIANDEGYVITVKAKGVTIEGRTPAGVFYGIQTLRKSLPVEQQASVNLPAARIADQPRFGYRGGMLDCGRHFFSVALVKEYIDILAMHNLNTFHWHLTEDQGWRVQIDRYPRLTEVGSVRKQTVIGHNSPVYDGVPYGGFYTKDQLKEIVKYAADRYITIIPEIDMPGHMLAALTAYPELGCTGGPYEVAQSWGVFDDILCAGKSKTYEFAKNVLDELLEIFPSKFIHLGGDEAPRKRWEACPDCQAEIKRLGLKGSNGFSAEAQLQCHFLNVIAKHLEAKGRNVIGWDEVLEGDIVPGTTVMSWRGVAGGQQAAERGLDAIMTPTDYYYLDYYQNKSTDIRLIGGYLPVDKVYSYNPVPDDASEALKKHVIGVQGNLWTEYIPYKQLAEYQLLPRMAAIAETGWTDNKLKDFNSFKQRNVNLYKHYKLLDWAASDDMFH
ncbi:beta-N-acetylhexosaminidase [Prevotella sp.]|uniref:beta-N-acetylhexosaminidase n=1 Tax=Prevotella sp. TaxID=59823 RepID=UPI002F955416